MKNRFIIWILVLFALLTACGASAESEACEVLYFYENYCESCTPEESFRDYFKSLTGLSMDSCAYTAYNIVHDAGRKEYEAVCASLNLTDPSVPMAVVNGVAYCGSSEMETALPEAALSWGAPTDSTIVYLYVPACESCAKAVAVLDALPETVSVSRGTLQIESRVVVERIDVSAQPETARLLFEAYNVPDAQRITPCVFLPDRYLSGASAIEDKLPLMVELGWAAGEVALPEAEAPSSTPAALTLGGTLAAGLAAGLNTCALSMLLMFLSVILEAKKKAGLLASCFLLSKFVCYLAIGFALTELLQRFNPHWLKPLARILLTAIGGALIALNLWDAWQAHRENYGKIRNQLPASLRGGLHRAIRSLTQTRVLVPAVIALGFIVALGEFLCAGQLYLMQLLSSLESGAGAQAANLVVYCAAFIAPSAALCAVVLRGGSRLRVSSFLAAHMTAAKLITAAVMLLLIVSAWLM